MKIHILSIYQTSIQKYNSEDYSINSKKEDVTIETRTTESSDISKEEIE